MNIHRIIIASAIFATLGFAACDDNVTTLGSSLIEDETAVVIDSSFTITGHSVENNDIQSRTNAQILGALSAREYGSFSSDFVAQFMPSLQLDTVGVSLSDIDSIKLVMTFNAGSLTGDSIVPMGFKVYPLTEQLPSPIYSDFDPSGYYDESKCWTPGNQIYTGNALYNDSISTTVRTRSVSVKLPKDFAVSFFKEYIDHPETFATPQRFAQFFPGLYVKNTFGSGRVINFSETCINLFYRRHAKVTKNGVERDTVYNVSKTYMAVTPEVVSNNIINMQISPSLLGKITNGDVLLVAPASYDAEIIFPTNEIIARYKALGGDMSVINTLTLSLPAEKIDNAYNINPPKNVLLILSKEKDDFFANNKITDDKTSFLATYNETTKSYEFSGMRQYLLDMLAKGTLTADDYTFTVAPVDVIYEQSSSNSYYYYEQAQAYISGVIPYVSGPSMCKLSLEKAKIKFTYSKQSIKN